MFRCGLAITALLFLTAVARPPAMLELTSEWEVDHEHKKSLRCVAINPDNDQIATADETRVRFWSMTDGKHIHSFDTSDVETLVFTPDGKQLILSVTPAEDLITRKPRQCKLLWYDLKAKRVTHQLESVHGFGPVTLAPNGKLFACANGKWNFRLSLRDASTGKIIHELSGGHFYRVAFSPDSKLIYSVLWNGDIASWDTATGKSKLVFPSLADTRIDALAVSPDGKTIASGESNYIRLYEAATGKLLFRSEKDQGCENYPCLRFTRDGSWLLSGQGNHIYVVDVPTRRLHAIHSKRFRFVTAFVVTSDDEWLVIASNETKTLHGIRLSEW
jgi:WD40 repeat protein